VPIWKLIAQNHHTAFRSLYAANFPRTGLEACNCLKRVICSGEALPSICSNASSGVWGGTAQSVWSD